MNSGKNLLILHQAWVAGGAELTTKSVLEGIEREQFDRVSLLCPQVMTGYWTRGYDHHIDTVSLDLAGWFETPVRLWRDAQALSVVLLAEQADLAIGVMHYSAAVLALAIRMTGVKTRLLANFRGPVFEHLKHFEPSSWRRAWIGVAIFATSHYARGIVLPSFGSAGELQRYCRVPSRKLHVIYSGIDYEEAQRRCALNIELPPALHREQAFAVVAARLSEEKRIDWTIQALAKINKDNPIHLLILGDGAARSELEHLAGSLGIAAKVHFHGQVSDVLPYLARSCMFIHTCQYEGFSNSILEALACGTPTIATDCPHGPREALLDNQFGYLVPMGDIQALAASMDEVWDQKIVQNDLRILRISQAKKFSINEMQRSYNDLFERLI